MSEATTVLGGADTGGAGATGSGAGAASGSQGAAGATGNPVGGNPGAATGGQSTSGGNSWLTALPEELRADASLTPFKDVTDLAKSYISTKAMVGKKGVIPPGEKATDEEWTAFYKSLGQPDLDKFQINTPQGQEINTELLNSFKQVFHKSGIMPRQAQAVVDAYLQHEKARYEAITKEHADELKQELEGLQKEWGQGYPKQISLAKMAVKDLGGPEFIDYLEETGLGSDPTVIRFMAKVGALMGEDKLRGEAAGRMGQGTPSEINANIQKVMSEERYTNHNHPGHKLAVQEVADFFKQLSPG